MQHTNRRIVLAGIIIASLLLSACAAQTATPSTIEPAKVEPIAGTDLQRVELTEQAARRIGLQTVRVRDELIVRTRTVWGEVVARPEAAGAALGKVWVRVPLTEVESSQLNRARPARVVPLDREGEDNGAEAEGLEAEVDEGSAGDDAELDDLGEEVVYYAVNRPGHGLVPGQRVLVEIALSDSGQPRKVIPYAAVLYDLNGETWVYTRTERLAFVRHPIVVDFIEGDLAFLLEGPEAGTEVVTTGAAELLGVESGVGE